MSAEREFFAYARERYSILVRRRNKATLMLGKDGLRHWTLDPILQEYRFCNVFREHDKTTEWFRRHVRGPMSNDPRVLLATYVFRWFNRVSTCRLLHGLSEDGTVQNTSLFKDWSQEYARNRLRDVRPLVTGAYMVKTPTSMNKLEGVLWCVEQFAPKALELAAEMLRGQGRLTLQEATKLLSEFPFMGPFMAYEVVTDLRHTYLLDRAPDVLTWASAGPGAARGLGRVLSGDPGAFHYNRPADQEQLLLGMRDLLRASKKATHWPREWPRWEMREVEHTLCEFDKYERTRLGEGHPKQRYRMEVSS